MRRAVGHLIRGFYNPVFRQRRIQVFCLGAWKTGTTSLWAVFKRNYRASHEAGKKSFLPIVQAYTSELVSRSDMERAIRQRDRRWWMEMDSAFFHAYVAAILQDLFPAAKFVLTIRPGREWLNSCYNHILGRGLGSQQEKFLWWVTGGKDYQYHPSERALEEKNLPSIDALLSYWNTHNSRVLKAIDSSRLLVIGTSSISSRIGDLASFVGVPENTLDNSHVHMNKASLSANVLDSVDSGYLEDRISYHCSDLIFSFHETPA